jgi:hypothetical protein
MNVGRSLKRSFLRKKTLSRTSKSRGRTAQRQSALSIEILEDRWLLSSGAFLQGFVYVDTNHNGRYDTGEGIAGATIRLLAADSTTLTKYPASTLSTVLGSVASAANGYYLLNDSSIIVPNANGLAPGNYLLVETPPPGYYYGGTTILSRLDPASQVSSNTIRVTLEDPRRLNERFDAFGPGATDSPTLGGIPEPGFTGQQIIHLADNNPPLTTPQFYSLCLALTQTAGLGATFPVLPAPVGSSVPNGGEIAYLYDHYGQGALDNTHGEALSEAVWELLYGSSFTPDLRHAGVAAAYNFFLADAAGKNEAAIFLDTTLGGTFTPPPGRGQSMIVTGSLNFFNVPNASPTLITTPGATAVIGSGGKLTDSAILSGGNNPAGTITFTLYSPSNSVVDTESVPVSGNGIYNTPHGYIPTATGTYQWVVNYSGDSTNNPAISNRGNEPETVISASPNINTVPGSTVVIGTSAKLTDTANLSGGFNATGSITFSLYSPSNTVVDSETVNVSGNGIYSTPNGYLPSTTGTYQWVASYSGDPNNNAAISNLGDEPEAVSAASPSINTTPGGTVIVGSGAMLTDSANLTGGFNPSGTITFTLYSTSNAVVDNETVSVSGDGIYSTPTGYLPSATGTYQWVASYSGDANNNSATSSLGDEPEAVSAASPSINTTPGGTVVVGSGAMLTDSANLSGGFNPSGTITFTLYDPSNTIVDTETVNVSGNGIYSTPTGYLPAATGTFEWVASYSGDGNNNGATSKLGDEPEAVIPAASSIVTTPGPTVVIGSGAKLSDSATLSGADNPTGTITFRLYDPSNTVVDTETVNISGNGTYSTPNGYLPSATGTYEWVASYSGDLNNTGSINNFGDEPEAVTLASPAINTTPGGTVTIGSGAKLTDSANLSGGFNPTGTITFTLYSPSNAVVDTETVNISGNGTYGTPNGYFPSATGTYQWVASYSGDANNNPVGSNRGDEPEAVRPASPAVNTIPGGTVVIGSGAKLTDSATLSGGFNPAGTITFTLYSPGNTVVDTEMVAVSGNGTYSTPNGYQPAMTGTYQWVASYSGDANNNGAVSSFGNEPEAASPASPVITTNPGGTVVIGSGAKLTDSANLSAGFNLTGTITFTLYSPANSVVDTETVTVSGNGTYTTPNGYLPATTGTYQWVAGYSGDNNNNSAISPLGSEPEGVSKASPAITTTPGGTVIIGTSANMTDSATLSGGLNPSGTITFTLYSPSNTVVDTETVTVTGDGTYTTPNGYVPTAAGTYQWVATYTGDSKNNGVTSPLGAEPETAQPGTTLGHGMTGTIGFWHNQNGQALINSFGTTSTGMTLANWLATTFPNLYGVNAGSNNNLTNKTNAQVAQYYLTLFNVTGQKVYAQVLATALAVFTTNTTLNTGANSQSLAQGYGFILNSNGTGAALYTVSAADGAAFGLSTTSSTTTTVLDLLNRANARAVHGILNSGNQTLINEVNDVFSGINQTGDIT